ncbi:MAG: insulinase family protein [Prevotellaceae bacterium]|jgi:predicted Zn-dependent peptidase|nr:insulinase family protein [Prevotellaceae bacterium]
MKKILSVLLIAAVVVLASCGKRYSYESAPNDPLKARIYTLGNGLKVYLTVYKDAPRIQTFVVVRAGGKNDPAETTGLAHYLEHLLFKGTPSFGSSDYAKEKPLLDSIEALFERYRTKTDEAERKAIYRQIDEVSQEAAQYAIANEYDKLMAAIGATGTNAYTSEDATVYRDDIPANQVDSWAKIQAERFANPVIRLFHTELETVYEEKNRSLTHDGFRVFEALTAGLFAKHPYGTQTVIGTQEHLKNPSIANIKRYFSRYYVPNNMAICMSGDFDPDEAIATIDKYFGALPRGEDVQPLNIREEPIAAPIAKTIYGKDAANVVIGFRFDGATSDDALKLKLLNMVLTNGKAGLIDLNVKQTQRLLDAGTSPLANADYQVLYVYAVPKQGQSLNEAKDIMLEQLEKVKKGEFDDWLLPAVVNDFKLSEIRSLEDNEARAHAFVTAFINQEPWADCVAMLDRMAKITKAELVAFANEKLRDNYVIIYKQTGDDPGEKAIDKPAITPVPVNRDAESAFLAAIKSAQVKPIEPVFLDFKQDIKFLTAKSSIPVLYKKNVENDLFEINYVFDMGSDNDKELALAVSYLQYLGTATYTAGQLKQEFYKLGCNFAVSSATERVYVSLNGLAENMEASLKLFEHLLANAEVNREAYHNLATDILKGRGNAKLNHNANFQRLGSYGRFGAKSSTTNILSESRLKDIDPQLLVDKIRGLCAYKHKILYYGPLPEAQLLTLIGSEHHAPEALKDYPAAAEYAEQPTDQNRVLFAHYKAPQAYMSMIAKQGAYDKSKEPIVTMFNEYFGGGMNSIVFQEMREARALAYTATASYNTPSRLDRSCYMTAFVGTQTDKLKEAGATFQDILGNMPQSENGFAVAKENLLANIRTQRITKSDVLWSYLTAQRLGLDYDLRRDIFAQVPRFTLADVVKFQEENVKNLTYTFCVLGDEKAVDFNALSSFGQVTKLSQSDIFGY